VIIEGRVEHEVELAAPPVEVFRMFTDPARLSRWIGISAELQPSPGGRFRFEVQPGQFCEGEYLVVEPPRRLVLTWGWTDPWFALPPGSSRVEVTLDPSPAGTRLRLVHDRLPREVRGIHDEGWALFLARLSAVLAGAEPPPYPPTRPGQLPREPGG
jgi:uncharacterized protein YndB with AHSA1/START domain